MADRSVAIIGGGIAGLSAGIYLQMNGYQTRIFELNKMVGGVSVSWKRRGYTFDGATNWLPGSTPNLNFHRILSEVFDFSKLQIIDFAEFARVELHSGVCLHVYKDADRLHSEMLRIAPEDATMIGRFMSAVRTVSSLQLPIDKPFEIFTAGDWLHNLRHLQRLGRFALRWRGRTIAEFAQQLRNPNLRALIQLILPHHTGFSLLGLITVLGWMNAKSTGYPLGGSAALAGMLEQKYRALGGAITFDAKVKTIRVRDGAACGVEWGRSESWDCDVVVSAADGHDTLFTMLGGRYLTTQLRTYYAKRAVFPATLQVSLGLGRVFAGEANKIIMQLDPPLALGADRGVSSMLVRICSFDPTFAPPGKTAVVVNLRTSDYHYWQELRATDLPAYRREKERVAQVVIDALEKRFGGVRRAVEVTDVATPATYIRYTNNWKASYQGWFPTPQVVGRSLKKTIPGLRNFYMTGQWVEPPGGIPRVVISARNVAQLICHRDQKPFISQSSG